MSFDTTSMSRLPNRFRRHITFANCASALALFIAASTGGAYAKATLIDGRTIKPNSIPASALQNNSVTSSKIKNGQIMVADVKSGAITGPKIASGTIPLGAISKSAQQALGVGQNESTPTGNGETAITKTQDGKTWEYALIDIMPKGAGLPCRVMNQTYPTGVWELSGTTWVCKITMSDGQIALTQPAKKGSPNTSGSGAVNV